MTLGRDLNRLRSAPALAAALSLGLLFALLAGELALRAGGALSRSLQERRNRAALAAAGSYRIMCLGESMTAGGAEAWPARLEEALNARFPGARFSVVNKAVPGADMETLLGSLDKNLDEVKPDLVVAMMGINDGSIIYYKGVPGADSFLFRHSRLYRWLRLLGKPGLTLRRDAPSIPPAAIAPEEADPYLEIVGHGQPPPGTEAALRKRLRAKPRDPLAVFLLGRHLTAPAPALEPKAPVSEEGERLLLEALRLAPKASYIHAALGDYYRNLGDHARAVPRLERAADLENSPHRWHHFAAYCAGLGLKEKSLAALERAVDLRLPYDAAITDLAARKAAAGDRAAAEKLLLQGSEALPDNERVREALAKFYEAAGRAEDAAAARRELEETRALLTLRSKSHWWQLYAAAKAHGARLACMQYPMRPLGPLQALLADLPGVIFIDNETLFKRAVKRRGAGHWFYDLFGGDFGHLTAEGHKLLADNAAEALAPHLEPAAGRNGAP